MRMKNYYMPTLREDPSEAEIASHKLLLRAGMIRRSASGVYSYLPLGFRTIKKVENIVRDTMDKYGAQEILMSAIQPQEIWEDSGRWDTFGPEMFKLKDRHGRNFCLGPTAEEYFTTLIKDEVKSYKQLPLNLYQIQTKYRDEKRPRFGINRAREFSMKDAYTFDKSQADLESSYMNMWKAYEEVFDKIGLDYRIVEGDSGAMGGNKSHEFIALSETGEGVIAYTEDNDFAATTEKAEVFLELPEQEEAKEVEKVHTPGIKTIDDLSEFLNLDKYKLAKAVAIKAGEDDVVAIVPGHRELNISKLVSYLQVPEHEIFMMDDEKIRQISGAEVGFTGPIGLDEEVRILIDKRVSQISNLVVGGNETDYHLINVNYGRDFSGELVDDLLEVEEGDKTHDGKELKFARGIEVGNIFQLGTKYSEALDATFLDENGRAQHFIMGSYGIGITRTVTAIVEQNHDEKGIVWPLSVAPYKVIITVVNTNNEEQITLAERIYDDLWDMGIETIIDDRKERPGVKFNDRDLIGIPFRLTVGKKAGEKIVEFSTRKDMENQDLDYKEAINIIKSEM